MPTTSRFVRYEAPDSSVVEAAYCAHKASKTGKYTVIGDGVYWVSSRGIEQVAARIDEETALVVESGIGPGLFEKFLVLILESSED